MVCEDTLISADILTVLVDQSHRSRPGRFPRLTSFPLLHGRLQGQDRQLLTLDLLLQLLVVPEGLGQLVLQSTDLPSLIVWKSQEITVRKLPRTPSSPSSISRSNNC